MIKDTVNINGKAKAGNTYDAIVIGSGISGGWAAKELTEKGLKTIMLERGRNYEHLKDYKTANKDPWEFEHRGNITLEQKKQHPIIGRGWGATEQVIDKWANDVDAPYTEIKPFNWWRTYQLGGRSQLWGRQSYRWSDFDFEANAKDGWAIDWPIRYADLAPWYDYVEKFAGISGSREGLPQLPDGHYLPPMQMNVVEKDIARRIKETYKGSRHMIIGRTANLTKAIPGRTACQFRNRCWEGCPFGGYFSTQSSTLPAAVATGNLTVRPFSIVTRILYDKNTQKATGVEVLDAETHQTYEYHAKIVFVNASALNSAWVLMNSATDVWEGGLGSSSGELGHNIMDHHYNTGAAGVAEGFEDRYVYGRRANGIYIPRFANLFGDKRNYLRGFGYQGGANRDSWSRDVTEMGFGADYKETLAEPGQWSVGITGFGELLPYHENKITLDKTRKDKWGLPVLAMDAELKDNEQKMRVDMMTEAKAMLETAGIKNITTWNRGHNIGDGIHEMGTARMGRDPKTSVLNAHNQVWDAKNVFVTDGAAMTSSACQNPSLTYMALTARAADFAISELKKVTFNQLENMNRRDAITRVALLMGGTVIGADLFLSGCKTNTDKVENLFAAEDTNFFNEVGNTIIPDTNTPGAKAANVGGFMAIMVRDCYMPEDQKVFLTAKGNIDNAAQKQFNKDFLACDVQQRTKVLNQLDAEQKDYNKHKTKEAPNHYFKMVKELTLLGYFTSKIGCTQAMRYVAIPGRYDGDVPYKKGDRAWATR